MASDICLPVQVAAISDGWTVNDMSMVLGFFIGVLVGAIVAVLCAKLCARDLNRVSTKQQVRATIHPFSVYLLIAPSCDYVRTLPTTPLDV